jgi:hypothetical protein
MTCSTNEMKMHKAFWSITEMGSNHYSDLSTTGRIILKRIVKELDVKDVDTISQRTRP